jgi:crotonobetainyl-CoA:carnitine CoA-transferase CaiB-like acyl-CoA transferase
MKKIRPEIVYSAISSYGQDGPYRDLSGFDPNFISVGGLLGITGDVHGNHVMPGIPIGDQTGGMLSTIGILLALRVRDKTGKGQFIDLSLADSVAYLVGLRHGPLYFSKGITVKRGGRLSHTYRTKDNKYLSFSFGTPVYWENVCKALGMEQYASYWREVQALGLEDSMGEPDQIRKKQKEAVECLARILQTKTRDEWFSILSRAGAAVSPVNEMDEVFSDPQLLHRQMVVQVDHPKLGPIRQVGMPIKLSDTPGKIRRLAPLRGEHTKEILRWLGYQDAEVTALLRQKIVR